jgi:multimeric flavodoxin WrbA
MKKLENVLILIGSPKGKRSASDNFATYLEEQLRKKGVVTETVYIVQHQKDEKMKEMVKMARQKELIIMVNPLYIDSIPAITIKFMEEFSRLQEFSPGNQQKLLVIFNSGFPEPHHNNLAIQMCEKFAKETGIQWLGGIAIGMGAAFEEKSLENAGSMARNLRKGLDQIAHHLALGEDVPPEALITASKPLMPLFFAKHGMRWLGGRMWKAKAHDESIKRKMCQRPYG